MEDPRIGAPLDALTDTPFLAVDVDVLDRNIELLQAYCRRHGLQLWPHAKTHKSAWIARRQLAAGADGLTFAKSREAELLAKRCATPRLLIAYPLFGEAKWRRACALAKEREVTVMLDSLAVAEGLSRAAQHEGVEFVVLVELDVGLRRGGVAGAAAAVELGALVDRLPRLRLRGLGCYPGHLREPDELDAGLPRLAALLDETVDSFDRAGLCRERVSAGSTKTAFRVHECPAVTESRAGTYVLGDLSDDPPAGFALTVQATVVSETPWGSVVDAGAKALSGDPLLRRGGGGFGALHDRSDRVISKLFDEHGLIPSLPDAPAPLRGERVGIVPTHCVAAMNLHDEFVVVRDGIVVDVQPIEARGAVG